MALLITEEDVRSLLAGPGAMAAAIALTETVLVEQARGRLALLPRLQIDYPPGSAGETAGRSLRLLPCIVPALGAAALRVYTTNKVGDPLRPAPCELILLFDHETMELRALIEDYSLHTLRTAAPTGVATDRLARDDATRIGVLGTGRHARGQLAAVASVRPPTRVDVHSRSAERRDAFCREARERLGVRVEPAATAEDAVRDADVVVVATTTTEPVLRGAWLRPGTHVNSIAPSELDGETLRRARVFPNLAEEVLGGVPAWPPVPELLASGELTREHFETELAAVVAGDDPGRTSPDEITLFLSTGMASWDVAAGVWADAAARRAGLGRELWDAGAGRSLAGLVAPLPSLA